MPEDKPDQGSEATSTGSDLVPAANDVPAAPADSTSPALPARPANEEMAKSEQGKDVWIQGDESNND
jgi:hypothetical protein